MKDIPKKANSNPPKSNRGSVKVFVTKLQHFVLRHAKTVFFEGLFTTLSSQTTYKSFLLQVVKSSKQSVGVEVGQNCFVFAYKYLLEQPFDSKKSTCSLPISWTQLLE